MMVESGSLEVTIPLVLCIETIDEFKRKVHIYRQS